MSYSIILTDHFKKEAKKLTNKIPLKAELEKLDEGLAENPAAGTPFGPDVYKVRLAIASKGKGNSGGARVITCVKVIDEKVYGHHIAKTGSQTIPRARYSNC